MSSISDIKLTRTNTTLDPFVEQKATHFFFMWDVEAEQQTIWTRDKSGFCRVLTL